MNRRSVFWATAAVFTGAGVLTLAACGGGSTPAADSDPGTGTPPGVQVFSAASAPVKLSAWQLLLSDGQSLRLQSGVLPYSLNTPLFSDYSHKFRTLWLPAGQKMAYTVSGPLQFPVGAIVSKSFFYPRAQALGAGAVGAQKSDQVEGGETIDLVTNRMVETRLMVREPGGRWGAVTYVWDADQRDATLVRNGQNIDVELVDAQGWRTSFTYAVPTDAQCLTCHATNITTGTFEAIGPQANNLNRSYAYAAGTFNQLEHLSTLQLLAGYTAPAPVMPVWNNPATGSLIERTRAYLDVNCASCHNSAGRSGHTGLWLGMGISDPLRLGVCKEPLGGQQFRQFSYDVTPGDAEASFLYFRLGTYRNTNPRRVAMPELGRHVFHTEGNALVRDWINGMTAGCP